MSSIMLPPIIGNAEYELSEAISDVPPNAPREDMEVISRAYRIRGIGLLLLTGSPEELGKNLQKSATAWLAHLRQAKEDEKAASKAAALFCAIGCGDLETAAEIARHSRYTHNRDEEYEDDFLYVGFLMRRLLLGADDAEAQEWVARLEAYLQGDPSAKLDLCRAFLARDAAGFERALEARIAEHRDWLEQLRERDALVDEEDATDGAVFVEGIALVRLGRREGFPTAEEYPLVPSLALRASAPGLGQDSWRDPEIGD